MRIMVTGATGFIGRALVPALQRDGHTVVALARSASRAKARLGGDVIVVEEDGSGTRLDDALVGADAVINLAGEPILGGRWTARRRERLTASRVQLTARLVRGMSRMAQPPRVLISGSAVGYYGNRGETLLPEGAAAGHDFLGRLCQDWEGAANAASTFCRVVTVRTGVVLGRDGGALPLMAPAFRLGIGGPLGNGRQYLPWIHLYDLVEVFVRALENNSLSGPVNGVAPCSVTSRDFARTMGQVLGRPALLPLPAFALRAALGDAAGVLLDSQRAHPAKLTEAGFAWRFPTLAAALTDLLTTDSTVSITNIANARMPGNAYLQTRPARYLLSSTTTLNAPLARTFEFFSKPENLGLLTPSGMQFRITGQPAAMAESAAIDYRIRVGAVPMRWRTRIACWEPGHRFVDVQEAGPYRSWYHEHAFRADGPRTIMEDRVYYAPPLGVLGRMAHALVIAPMLRRIFQYRQDVIRLRFGAVV